MTIMPTTGIFQVQTISTHLGLPIGGIITNGLPIYMLFQVLMEHPPKLARRIKYTLHQPITLKTR